MGFSGFVNVAALILMASSFVRTLMADPRANVVRLACNSSEAVSGAILATNFVPAMDNLSSLVNQNGFGTSVVGKPPNAVFGLAQCYKDLTSIDCTLCFSEIRSTLPKCYPRTGGRIFLDGCFGRFENFSFFNQGVDMESFENCSSSKNSSQPDRFSEGLRKVIGHVSLAAQRSKGFAVASHSISNLTVYALAQCWESLDVMTCNSCIQAADSAIMSCSPSFEGRSLNAGCYMRYSTEVFWNLDQTTMHSSGKLENLRIILGLGLGGFLFLIGIGFWKARGYLGRLYDSYGSGLSATISFPNVNFRYQELRRATNRFDASNKLGQGSYGTVYKGVLPDGREVAVK